MRPAILFALFAVASCRTPAHDESAVKAGPVLDATPEGAAGEVDCKANPLAAAKTYTAESLREVSSKCVFNDGFHEVRMLTLGETFEKILKDGCEKKNSGFGHAIEVTIDGVKIPNVGYRVRGNTSKCNPKRQFRLRFDVKKAFSVKGGAVTELEFPENKNRRYHGLANLNLRASGNDPSFVREHVSSRIFAAADELAPVTKRGPMVYDTTFTKFYVSFNRPQNQGPQGNFKTLFEGKFYDYKGVYTIAENIDDVFLKSRFGVGQEDPKGFYLFGATAKKSFFDRTNFVPGGWEADFVDGEEPEDEAALAKGDAKLFELIDLLIDDATDDQLAAAIDMDSMVNYFAGATLSGHWDSVLGNGNNDLLFFDGETGKWKIITWDLDNSLGVIKARYDEMMQDDIYKPAAKIPARLFQVLFAPSRPGFREKLRQRHQALASGFYSAGQFDAMIDGIRNRVMPKAAAWEGLKPQLFQDIKNFAKARRTKLAPQVNAGAQ